MGGHKGAHLALRLPQAAAQELDLIAAGISVSHVSQGHLPDALGGHLLGIDVLAAGQSGHVGGGVLLGVAVVLGLLERLLKGEARLDHAGEDIVGGAVENTGDLLHLVGSQAVGERAQDGDTAAHAGLKEIADSVGLSQLQQLVAVGGHQLLVGGDHALTRLQGAGGELQSHLGSADGLHHHVHLGVVLNDGKVLHEAVLKGAVGEIPHVQDVFDLDLAAGAPGNALAVLTEHLGHAGTDGAEA